MKKLIFKTLLVTMLALPAMAMEHGKTVYADVNGLICDFCARALDKVFSRQEEVSDIAVDLDTKVVTINLKEDKTLSDEKITKLITDSGYDVRGIRREPVSEK